MVKYQNILEDIYQSSLKFLVPLNAEETYATIVHEANRLVGGVYGSILLDYHGEIKRVYSNSPYAYKTKNRKRGFTFQAFSTGKTVVADISQTREVHPELLEYGIKKTIFIPMSYQGKSVGVITVNLRGNSRFNNKDVKSLELFGSMASLAIQKNKLFDETKKALVTRDLFISMAAHELRTPVTTIYGYAQMLHQKIGKKNTAEARWADALHTECYRLTLLIQDLLEITRIRSGKLQFALVECLLQEVIARAADNFKFNYPERTVIVEDLTSDKNSVVVADFNRLLQVLINLLDNAAKFSPADKEIKISLSNGPVSFSIKVIDQGIGIAKKDLPKIFDRYYQADQDFEQGLGLGLFLVKNIVAKLHGSIKITSKIKQGTTVEIKLPKVVYE